LTGAALLRRTTCERAARSPGDACFALAEQASEEAGPAQLLVVLSDRPAAVDRDACLSAR
jgi:hypothetical protein